MEKLGQWEDKVKDNSVVTSLNITWCEYPLTHAFPRRPSRVISRPLRQNSCDLAYFVRVPVLPLTHRETRWSGRSAKWATFPLIVAAAQVE